MSTSGNAESDGDDPDGVAAVAADPTLAALGKREAFVVEWTPTSTSTMPAERWRSVKFYDNEKLHVERSIAPTKRELHVVLIAVLPPELFDIIALFGTAALCHCPLCSHACTHANGRRRWLGGWCVGGAVARPRPFEQSLCNPKSSQHRKRPMSASLPCDYCLTADAVPTETDAMCRTCASAFARCCVCGGLKL